MSSSQPRTALRQPGSGTATPTGTHGSQTILQTTSSSGPSATLRLRAAQPESDQQRRIQWAEDVVDNEGMGKKSSKVCCIYHKPHEPGDSDSDSDSSDSDSDSEPDLSRARKAGSGSSNSRGRRKDAHAHDHKGEGDSGNGEGSGRRKASPNAYERQPKHTQKGKQKQDG